MSHSPAPSPEAYWEAIRQSATARVVLPESEEDLERAACRLLQRLTTEQWGELDEELHERVLRPRGGLHGALIHSGDLARTLTGPLIEEVIDMLGRHLPIMDVAQILAAELGLGEGAAPTDLKAGTREYLDRATPLFASAHESGHYGFLLAPASESG